MGRASAHWEVGAAPSTHIADCHAAKGASPGQVTDFLPSIFSTFASDRPLISDSFCGGRKAGMEGQISRLKTQGDADPVLCCLVLASSCYLAGVHQQRLAGVVPCRSGAWASEMVALIQRCLSQHLGAGATAAPGVALRSPPASLAFLMSPRLMPRASSFSTGCRQRTPVGQFDRRRQ